MMVSRSRRSCRIQVVRAIPDEMLEEILLHLPLKSLLRFSSVSRLWHSIINHPRFLKKYVGHERIISLHHSYSLSSLLSDDVPIHRATKLVPPPGVSRFQVRAFCNGLWCVQNIKDNSLFIWNPSMGTYRKLLNPMLRQILHFYYGLGYDVVGDDYKLLNIEYGRTRRVMLYSLKSDSWREIQSFPEISMSSWSWFVSGALHWLCYRANRGSVIVSFDLSREDYGEVGMPAEYDRRNEVDKVEVVVLRGKLCLSVNYWDKSRFVLWMMEEYGVVGSWRRKFDVDYSSICGFGNGGKELRALCMSRYGEIVIYVTRRINNGEERRTMVMLMDANGKILMRKDFGCTKLYGGGLVYNETLVSPAL